MSADIRARRAEHGGTLDRRNFLKVVGGVTGTVLLSSAVSAPLLAQFGERRADIPAITDPSVKALVFKGVQAARGGGAQYADVRLTNSLLRFVDVEKAQDTQMLYAAVRALVNGHWGFASGPVWDDAAIVALAQRAVLQAKAQASTAGGKGIDIGAWPTIDVVRNGHWQMPVKIDPLSLHPFVIQDFLRGIADRVDLELGRTQEQRGVVVAARFMIQERALGTSDDSYCTQRLYLASGTIGTSLAVQGGGGGSRAIQLVSPAGQGWELFADQSLSDVVLQKFHDIRTEAALPVQPVTTGKYALMLDAITTARLTSQTIGAASEIDRALGYEANASGRSYLNNPAKMLDAFAIGSPLLTVTANRSEPGGAATVQWDDEGVVPRPFTIVKDGVFHDYHLSRQGVSWLKDKKIAGREHPYGVMSAIDGTNAPSVRTANLHITPSATNADDTELMYQTNDGILIEDAEATMDASKLNGMIVGGRAYEVKGGKKVARIMNSSAMIHTPTLWKSLTLLGGAKSQVRIGLIGTKGEPLQPSFHSVTAVPAVFRDQTVTDILLR